MTGRVIWAYTLPGRYTLLRGIGLSSWLRAQRIPAVRAPLDRGHRLRKERLPDLEAAAAEDGIRVVVRGGERA